MRRCRALALAAVVIAPWALRATAALGEDAPEGPAPGSRPAAPAKIANAFLDSLVGSWDTVTSGPGPELKGVERFTKAAGGTVLIHESQRGPREHPISGLGVLRVEADGKSVKFWGFDPMAPDAIPFRGTLGDDGVDVKADAGFVLHLRKKESGPELVLALGEQTISTTKFTKTAKPVELAAPHAPKDDYRTAMIGDWSIAAEWSTAPGGGPDSAVKMTGSSSFRWAMSGFAIAIDWEMTTPGGSMPAFGLRRWTPDGAQERMFWFGAGQTAPRVADGTVKVDTWTGTIPMPDGSKPSATWAKRGETFEFTVGDPAKPLGREVYTRKPK